MVGSSVYRRAKPFCRGIQQRLQFPHGRVAAGEGALEVIEDHQRGFLFQGLGDGFDFIAFMDLEILLHEGIAQLVQDEVEAGSRFEGDERRPLKEPRAREPFRGLRRERGLALSAESVQDNDVRVAKARSRSSSSRARP